MIRHAFLAVAVFTLAGAALAADEPATAKPGADAAGQSPAQSGPSARRAKRLAWEMQTMLAAYETVGHRDANWDELARQALKHQVAKVVEGIAQTGDEEDALFSSGRGALQVGCRDGLVQYVVARGLSLRTGDPDAVVQGHQAAADALRDSKYPAYRKAIALLRAATYTAGFGEPDSEEKARGYADAAVALMPEIFADKELPVASLNELLDILAQAGNAYGGDPGAMGDKALAALEASPQPRSAVLTGKGSYYICFAWAARGSGFANTVTDEGWKLFAKRIAVARASLEEAWKLDPANADAAAAMITVEMATGENRAAMERWYGRAMKADPSCREAALAKMTWLEPKWHGDPKAMLAFGRELLAGGNWDATLPLLLANAHWALACYGPGGLRAVPDPGYFARNPKPIWADVKGVYEPYLKKVPDSRYHRTRYALMAAWCGEWAEANRQFDHLAGSYSRRVVPPDVFMSAVQQARDNQATAPESDAATGEAPAPKDPADNALPF
jgi:hypothetical protein